MFSPVGPQSPSVYWRRRLLVIGALVVLVVLVVLTVQAASGGGGGDPAAASQNTSSSRPASTSSSRPSATTSKPAPRSSTTTKSSASTSASPTKTSAAAVAACRTKDLSVAAVVGQTAYKIGDEPMVEVQVTNAGAKPCVQDLADRQVVLKVYNGESRVWGSHDCEVQGGTAKRTLGVNQPVRVSVKWSGYTSQPKCAGTRQRVGAGSYTLYATLAGKTGKAAQFTIG